MLAMTSVISWRPDWAWRFNLQGGSHAWLVSCGLLFAGDLNSLPWVPLRKAAWVSSLCDSRCLFPEDDSKGYKAETLWSSLRSHTALSLQCILLVAYVSLIHCGRGLQSSINTKRWGSLGTVLESDYYRFIFLGYNRISLIRGKQ